MIRSGKVIATQGITLKVCFSRLEACDSCNLCGSGRDDTTVFIKGRAEVGDRVEVDMPESQVLKVSLLVRPKTGGNGRIFESRRPFHRA